MLIALKELNKIMEFAFQSNAKMAMKKLMMDSASQYVNSMPTMTDKSKDAFVYQNFI